jgi:hypothetical protein
MTVDQARFTARSPDYGPNLLLTHADSLAVDQGNTTNRETLSAAVALAGLRAGICPLAMPLGAIPAGFMVSQYGADAASLRVELANLTAAPADPASVNYVAQQMAGVMRQRFQSAVGLLGVNAITARAVDHGNIVAAVVVEAAVAGVVLGASNFILGASPRAALPVGLALSHCRISGGAAQIGLANLTGGAIDPAPLDWNLAIANFVVGSPQPPWRSGRGAPMVLRTGSTVPLTWAAIAAGAVLEVQTPWVGARLTDTVVGSIDGLPVGAVLSHARADTDVLIVGVGNLTGAPLDVGPLAVDVVQMPRGVMNLGTIVP